MKAYVAAYDRHSPAAICALQSSIMRHWETSILDQVWGAHGITCNQAAGFQFHPMQDNPPPVFKHVTVAAWRGRGLVGDLAWVSAEIHVAFPNGPALNDPQYTSFYLTSERGNWRVLQDGGLSQIVAGSNPSLIAALPPLTAQDVTRTTPIPAPGFTCSGPVTVSHDPANDVRDEFKSTETSAGPAVSAPWVDIRRVALYGLNGSHPCIEVTFAAPIRADTLLDVSSDGTSMMAGLAFGNTRLVPWQGLSARAWPYGEEGSTIRFLLERGAADGGISICAVQPLFAQPLLGGHLSAPEDDWNIPGVDDLPRHCG